MKVLLVLLALGMAVSAIPYKFNHDIKIEVYDVFKALYAAAPLSSYFEYFSKGHDFTFSEDFFKYYSNEQIKDFVVVFKPSSANYLHGYYMKTGDVSKYGDNFFTAVHPIYEYLNSGEYYAFTPLAAKQIVPNYFSLPLKKIFYEHYGDVDLKHDIPLVFLIPKSEVHQADLKDFLHVADYNISKDGVHDVVEYFDSIEKHVARRDVAYVAPTVYGALPYTYNYDSHYAYYNQYLKTGYPYYNQYVKTGYPYYNQYVKTGYPYYKEYLKTAYPYYGYTNFWSYYK